MKKLSGSILAMCIAAVCASSQSMAEQISNAPISKSTTLKGNENIEFPASLTSTQFSEKLIKQIYPQATYEDGYFLLEDSSIDSSFKDILTETGEKRYAYIFQPMLIEDLLDVHLFVFNKKSGSWVLEQQMSGQPDLVKEGVPLHSIDIVSLGKNQLGFELFMRDGGSASERSNTYWIYDIDGQLKTLSGCSTSSERFSELDTECTHKIRSDATPNGGFYPIELSYNLTKYDVITADVNNIPKGYEWTSGTSARKEVGSKKGSVLAKFDEEKQEYVFPTSFEEILNTDDDSKFWKYFK